ncbi:MAG TPA: hypothetical protein VF776_08175 [Sphingomicrobium sp.]
MRAVNERKRTLTRSKGAGVLASLLAAIGWGIVCGVLRTPYWTVAVGGTGLAAIGFWLERSTLASPETMARKDFYLILVAGFGFFVIVGIGVASLSALIATWYLPRI